jgi:hypothetical protein
MQSLRALRYNSTQERILYMFDIKKSIGVLLLGNCLFGLALTATAAEKQPSLCSIATRSHPEPLNSAVIFYSEGGSPSVGSPGLSISEPSPLPASDPSPSPLPESDFPEQHYYKCTLEELPETVQVLYEKAPFELKIGPHLPAESPLRSVKASFKNALSPNRLKWVEGFVANENIKEQKFNIKRKNSRFKPFIKNAT